MANKTIPILFMVASMAAASAAHAEEKAIPIRQTTLTHQIFLKNGQHFDSAIAERDAKGLWAETAPGVRVYFKNAEIEKVVERGEGITIIQSVPPPSSKTPSPRAAPPAASPARKKAEPARDEPLEGEEILTAIRKAIEDRNANAILELYDRDGVEQEMLDTLRPFAEGLVNHKLESMKLRRATESDQKPMEHDGYRYRTSLPVIGKVVFEFTDYPGQSSSVPYGKKGNKYYLVTAIKEKIEGYVPPVSGPVLLNGKTFEGRTGPMGQVDGEPDTYTFKDGRFNAASNEKAGYGDGEFNAEPKNEGAYFTAETRSLSGGTKSWWGFIVNDALSGGVTTVEGGRTTDHYIMGSLKQS